MMEKIAITGANGFLGQSLCKELTDENYHVIAGVLHVEGKKEWEERICDVTNEKQTLEFLSDADVVVHLAAISNPAKCSENFDLAYRVNVEGTRNVIKAAKSKRMVFASTSHVYGIPASGGICFEDDPMKGTTPYAITKIMGENLCNNYSRNFGYRINIARLFNIYGANQPSNYVIPTIIIQALTKQEITLRRAQLIRDFLYVTDAARALMTIIKNGIFGQTYNVGRGVGTSVQEVANYVRQRIDEKISIRDMNLDGPDPLSLIAGGTKLRNIGWDPTVPLDQGIDKAIDFFNKELKLAS